MAFLSARFRSRGAWRISALVLAVSLLLTSCNEAGKHKMLTFFFDGVPPLHGKASVAPVADANDRAVAAGTPAPTWHVHEPVKDCTLCHGQQRSRGFSSRVHLVADPPQLCYQCHSRFTALQGWVHGPVAAGDCLLCHEPHRTRNEALLAKPVPELCYQCHEKQAIHAIERHAEPSYAHCIDCHDGHSSTTRSLLRPDVAAAGETGPSEGEAGPRPAPGRSGEQTQGQDTLSTEEPQSEAGAPKEPGSETLVTVKPRQDVLAMQGQEEAQVPPQGQELPTRAAREQAVAALYYRSIKQFHAGQLREARAGFLEALQTGLLPDPMRETAEGCLEKIDEAFKESR